jgi:predicted esterase
MKKFVLSKISGPHQHAQVTEIDNSSIPKKALLLFHGRGSGAENILQLARGVSPSTLILAPQAMDLRWYPYPFTHPKSENEPFLASALEVVDGLIQYCAEQYSLSPQSLVLAGFSQGACLVSEYTMRNPKRYGGICLFSGGLIGSDDEVGRVPAGDLQKTSVFIGCDSEDPYIPIARVDRTSEVFLTLNASVTLEKYENTGHSVLPSGITFMESLCV